MADTNVGYATLQIIPSFKGGQAALASGFVGPASSAGSQAGGAFGGKFATAVKFAGPAAIAAIGGSLIKLGSSFDEQFDKIRVGTGATGEALQGLEGSFKNVLSNTATDFDSAGTAIADLNTRLGLTGEPLETLSKQFLDLSRITGTDVTSNIDTMTRVFGDWGIATEDQAESLDAMYRAAQASGIGLDDLSGSVVSFGAPLRNLGFGFDESLALLAQFNKTGVNTATVFAGLKAGVGKLAKEGEDVPETFRRIVDEITAMGPGSEATGKAIELFGQRAGPDLADAIAGGKFEIEAMLSAITDGEDTIAQASSDTEDFGEKWTMLKNRVFVGLEPIASRLFEAIGTGMDRLGPIISDIVAGISGFVDTFKADGLEGLTSAFTAWVAETAPILGEKLLALGQQLVDWVGPRIPDFLAALAGFIGDGIVWILEEGVPLLAEGAADLVPALVDWVVNDAIPGFVDALPGMLEAFDTWLTEDAVPAFLEGGKALAFGLAEGFWNSLGAAFSGEVSGDGLTLDLGPLGSVDLPNIGIFGRASGGPVNANQPYIVGEKRPELFVPNQSGYVLPRVPDFASADSGAMGAAPLIGSLTVQQMPGEDSVSSAMRELKRIRLLAGVS